MCWSVREAPARATVSRYERNVRDAFGQVRSAAVWKTVAGTVEMFVCTE
jgi:hypothetical protein